MHGNSAFLAVFYQSLLLLLFPTSWGLTCSLSFDSIDLFWVLGNLLVGSRGPRLLPWSGSPGILCSAGSQGREQGRMWACVGLPHQLLNFFLRFLNQISPILPSSAKSPS